RRNSVALNRKLKLKFNSLMPKSLQWVGWSVQGGRKHDETWESTKNKTGLHSSMTEKIPLTSIILSS
uniref:hypothetical protein n=1 Tax=Bartonella sp. AP72JLCBS TaxID=3243502 RepID=UPI0035CEAD62